MKKTGDIAIAFFGTSAFSVEVLEGLKENGIVPALIVTQPDRPKGRGQHLAPPPAKEYAIKEGIETIQPEKLQEGNEGMDVLLNTEWDAFIVASYGLIMPKRVVELPRHGSLNVHPSILPLYRGASPIQSHILADDSDVGVTIMLMDEKMDHGPIVAQGTVELEEWPLPAPVLEALLAREGANLLAEALPLWIAGAIEASPQAHDAATYTRKFKKEDGLIDRAADPYENYLKINAFAGTIGTFFFHASADGSTIRVKIAGADFVNGALQLQRVIPEGKKEMSYEDFVRTN